MEERGYMLFSNGDSYEGEFKNNEMNGFGIYKTKSDGSEFRGYYSQGKKHGEGILICKDVSHRGNWNNGLYCFYWNYNNEDKGKYKSWIIFSNHLI